MKEQVLNYETPIVEIMEVYVEKGFVNSPDTETGDGTFEDEFIQGGF